ncbi:type IV pilin protein [candidate division KSB1 bacterium]
MLRKNNKAFSLVELLVVITIIAILSVVAYVAVGGQTVKARDSRRKQDLSTMQQALEIYYSEKGVYPSSPLTSGSGAGQISKKILSIIPKDPGIGEFDYVYKVSGSTYEIAATLEIDGDVANYEAYVVGNSDDPFVMTVGTDGRYLNGTVLDDCAGGFTISSGKIGTSASNGNCIPYDPNYVPTP